MKTSDQQLNVGQLIAQLQTFDPALPVVVEGCDCVGQANGTSLYKDHRDGHEELWITRIP